MVYHSDSHIARNEQGITAYPFVTSRAGVDRPGAAIAMLLQRRRSFSSSLA